MAQRPCLGCGRLVNGSRCPGCQVPRTSNALRRPDYGNAERVRRSDAVAQWRAERGDVCPGWGVPPHASTDLTADHVVAVANGGSESGPLTILCRRCNGRKGARG